MPAPYMIMEGTHTVHGTTFHVVIFQFKIPRLNVAQCSSTIGYYRARRFSDFDRNFQALKEYP